MLALGLDQKRTISDEELRVMVDKKLDTMFRLRPKMVSKELPHGKQVRAVFWNCD